MFTELLTRLRFLLVRKPHREVDEELQFHLEQQIEVNIAAGMTPQEARRQAMIAFGGVERAREQSHEQRPGYLMETLLQDIRYAIRGFRRNPVFTITIIATLALGIGATTAVFSVVDPILFRPLPYARADYVCMYWKDLTSIRIRAGMWTPNRRFAGPIPWQTRSQNCRKRIESSCKPNGAQR